MGPVSRTDQRVGLAVSSDAAAKERRIREEVKAGHRAVLAQMPLRAKEHEASTEEKITKEHREHRSC